MTTSVLTALDLVATVVGAGAWVGVSLGVAGFRGNPTRRSARLTLALVALAALSVFAQGAIVGLLAQHGWWFVQEKAVFALPLAAIGTIVALATTVPLLVSSAKAHPRPVRVRPIHIAAPIVAALAVGTGLLARLVVGYPMTPIAAVELLTLVVAGSVLALTIVAGAGRRLVSSLVALTILVAVGGVGIEWMITVASPAALPAAHTHLGTPPDPDADAAITPAELRLPDEATAATGNVRAIELVAREETVILASGRHVRAWDFGSLPGPELRVNQGDIVVATVRNENVSAGVTIHWHGYDVPNGDDGVAGVTQDAVLPGESFTYRFAANDAGTYWYHTHQNSSDGVRRGLYGTLIVLPPDQPGADVDIAVPVHSIGGTVLLGASDGADIRAVPAGSTVRIRLINTDQLPRRFRFAGAPVLVAAVDGHDLSHPTPIDDAAVRIPAGGRADLLFTMPADGVRLTTDVSRAAYLALSPNGSDPVDVETDATAPDVDLLSYGSGPMDDNGAAAGRPVVEAEMVLDRQLRFFNGRPTEAYTVNGMVYPHIPSIEVNDGDLVRLTVANRGWETHPMHVHGHHVRVVSVDGVHPRGSPLVLDTFDVQPGEVWVVEFVADNPGIWMDHCHNLDHAAAGMMMALRYRGIDSGFDHGGAHGNEPE